MIKATMFFLYRFTQLTGAVVEMSTELPRTGAPFQCTSGRLLLPSLFFLNMVTFTKDVFLS